jgi:hypothetical protein
MIELSLLHLAWFGVAVLHRQMEIGPVDTAIGMNELVFYELPDNTDYLIAIEFDAGNGHLEFAHDLTELWESCGRKSQPLCRTIIEAFGSAKSPNGE